MDIKKHTVVTIDYTLRDTEGQILDTSENKDPLSYVHGTDSIVSGLEEALDGKTIGDSVSVTVDPDDGYGHRNDELVFEVDKEKFDDPENLDPGVQFVATVDGDRRVFTVANVKDEKVVVDGNHPLAGMTLSFDVEVKDVRDATDEEVEHGHVHDGSEDHG